MAGVCLGLLPSSTQAQLTPVFDYTFPASWNGTGTTIVDQSTAGNNGIVYNYSTTHGLALSPNVPTGAAAGTQSINGSYGGIVTSASGLLNNAAIAAAGGFTYNVEFNWSGAGLTGFGVQKIVDYAGTESLQLGNYTQGIANNTSATLEMTFNSTDVAVTDTIQANTWYDVTLSFDSAGNSIVNGGISGQVGLYVNGVLVDSQAATKSSYGDSLDRPIGVANLGLHYKSLVGFSGDIYSASVDLGSAPVPTPEPSTLALGALGGLGVLGMKWKARRKV